MSANLLPSNATNWERAVAGVLDTSAIVSPAITLIRGTKIVSPPPSFLPFLIYEYGLGELTPYVPNLYGLIAEGIDWQRVRGTPAAMALALSWLGYTAAIEEERTQRRYWNMFQLELDRVRDVRSDLERIAGVALLSVPRRSVFWRGFHGLDIRPLTYSESHYSEAHYSEYSGVRLAGGGPLWSFGRIYQFSLTPSEADLRTLGVWIGQYDTTVNDFGPELLAFEAPIAEFAEDVPEQDGELGWDDFSWDSTEASWVSSAARARSEAMASGIVSRSVWFVFLDADGEPIGYRRARAQRSVVPASNGPYELAGVKYQPTTSAQQQVYLECQTGFGEGDGAIATHFGIVLDAQPIDETRPGQMWLDDSSIVGASPPTMTTPIAIKFGESIRERVKVLLSF